MIFSAPVHQVLRESAVKLTSTSVASLCRVKMADCAKRNQRVKGTSVSVVTGGQVSTVSSRSMIVQMPREIRDAEMERRAWMVFETIPATVPLVMRGRIVRQTLTSASLILASMAACATIFPGGSSFVCALVTTLGSSVKVRRANQIHARQTIPWNVIPQNREGDFNVLARQDSLESDVKSTLTNAAQSLA